MVAAGTYGPFETANRTLHIVGIEGAERTVIDGGGNEACMNLSGNAGATGANGAGSVVLDAAANGQTTYVNDGETFRFYDSGGASGNYANYENRTHTFRSVSGRPCPVKVLSAAGESCCDDLAETNGTGVLLRMEPHDGQRGSVVRVLFGQLPDGEWMGSGDHGGRVAHEQCGGRVHDSKRVFHERRGRRPWADCCGTA